MSQKKILIVDDDLSVLESTARILEASDFLTLSARSGAEALELLRRAQPNEIHLVLSDLRMPGLTGLELLSALRSIEERIPVILMTAFGEVQDAVWALKHGASDFITKPFKRRDLLASLQAALLKQEVRSEGVQHQVASTGDSALEITGDSAPMRSLRSMLARVASADVPVLVTGESGVGKERVSRTIHLQSARAKSPFIAVNCAAIPESLMESELFGHERGAFTGASHAKPGLLEAANGGSLFLDEIGELALPLQAKLLRVLQDGEVRRLGATATRKVSVRIIAATNRDLRKEVALGRFREDLLFRLDVLELRVPPLRERREDLGLLTRTLVGQFRAKLGRPAGATDPRVLAAFQAYGWPGNVRELANVIERALVLSPEGDLRLEDLPSHLIPSATGTSPRVAPFGDSAQAFPIRVGMPLREVEDLLIQKTLAATEGDKELAAKLLGVNARTIYRRLAQSRSEDPNEAGTPPEVQT